MLEELIAGDTLDFLDTVDEYPPADGWTLKYQLIPRFTTPAQSPITITATTSGTNYRSQAAAAVTAGWKPGAYTWARWVEKAGPIRQSLGDGQLLVKQDPAAAVQGYDGRSDARRRLDELDAAIEALSSGAVKQYTIGNRSMTKQDLPDLITWRDRLAAEVASEDAVAKMAAGLPNPRNVGIRFSRP
jgi:hypothetical protein